MKIISINQNKSAIMFEVKYNDGTKFIIIPTIFWNAFEHIYSFAFRAGGSGEFLNEFPSKEEELKVFHKAFKIEPRNKITKVQVWNPDNLEFTRNSLTNADGSNPLIQSKLEEWWRSQK